jgi:hypothetical protein
LSTRPNKSIPEPWLSFLRELDAAVREEVRLECMGGFVVTMVHGFSRPTGDLDVLEIAPRDAGRLMLKLGMKGGPLHIACSRPHSRLATNHRTTQTST